jgi:hypothetical protein
MDLPSKNNVVWQEVVLGRKKCRIKFLAARILHERMMRLVKEEPSTENINESVERLYAIFANNISLQVVQDDLKELFDCGG